MTLPTIRLEAISDSPGWDTRLLLDKLTDLQHQYHDAIMSSVHVHLDHNNCQEVILVRGKSPSVRKLADALIAMKGVKHGKFMLTTSEHDLP